MNTYELTILYPEGKVKDKERIVKMIEEFVKKHKGELIKQENWGIKTLAYEIKKQTKADYEHFILSLNASDQPTLEKLLRLEEMILRHLFVRV